jgi:hypothetical protein
MNEEYLQILPAPEETTWVPPVRLVANLWKRIKTLNARVVDLEVELSWYRASFGHVSDQEIKTIISNL